jgi:hypothetical protein
VTSTTDHLQRRHNARRKARKQARLAAQNTSFFAALTNLLTSVFN